MRGSFFSIGGLLAAARPRWQHGYRPWIVSASLLAMLALWDPILRGGRADFILLGLAAYELLIALTAEEGKSGEDQGGA
jgi:hypothetical protein